MYGLFVLDTQRVYEDHGSLAKGESKRSQKALVGCPSEVGSDVFKNVPNY
jgi:hypothetical protein